MARLGDYAIDVVVGCFEGVSKDEIFDYKGSCHSHYQHYKLVLRGSATASIHRGEYYQSFLIGLGHACPRSRVSAATRPFLWAHER